MAGVVDDLSRGVPSRGVSGFGTWPPGLVVAESEPAEKRDV